MQIIEKNTIRQHRYTDKSCLISGSHYSTRIVPESESGILLTPSPTFCLESQKIARTSGKY